jgi:hypothetical protein
MPAPQAVKAPAKPGGFLGRVNKEAGGLQRGLDSFEDQQAKIRNMMKQLKDLDNPSPKLNKELEREGSKQMGGYYGRDVDNLEKEARPLIQIPKRMKAAQDKLQNNLRGGSVEGQTGRGTRFGYKPKISTKIPTRGVFNPRRR